jgi:cell division septum initiation protein DivIVA
VPDDRPADSQPTRKEIDAWRERAERERETLQREVERLRRENERLREELELGAARGLSAGGAVLEESTGVAPATARTQAGRGVWAARSSSRAWAHR